MRIIRKYISILMLALMLSLCFTPVSMSNNKEIALEFSSTNFEPYGGLDQEQTQYDEINFTLKGRIWSSQSFKPNIINLSRVKLYIRKTQEKKVSMIVSIRKSLEGEDIATVKLLSSQIPTEMQWIEFNFKEKITVRPDETYYIVAREGPFSSEVNSAKLEWGMGKNTRYTRGEVHTSEDGGKAWRNNTDLDFCFKTYGKNNPPNKPNTPIGPNNGEAGTSYTYSTNTTDPDKDQIQYQFDWGDGTTSNWSILLPPEETSSTNKTWHNPGIYIVKAKARDENGVESEWSDNLTVNITEANNPPGKPNKPIGPNSGETGISYTYITSTTDPEGEQIQYHFDWGDGSTHDVGPLNSGETAMADHIWTADGRYEVKVKAKDTNGKDSGWSEPLIIEIKTTNNPPEKPDMPDGPDSGKIGKEYIYISSTSDPDGDLVRYGWDWDGDGNVDELTNYFASGASIRISHSWLDPGIYNIKVMAEDLYGKKSDFSDSIEVEIMENAPPAKPSIIGPSSGLVGGGIMFSTSTFDPDDDRIYYMFDWGDGTISEWLGPYTSGISCEILHIFEQSGAYDIKVKAKDEYDGESAWSETFLIGISEPKVQITIKEGLSIFGKKISTVKNTGDEPFRISKFKVDVEYGIFGKTVYSEKNDFTLNVDEEVTSTINRLKLGLLPPIGPITVKSSVTISSSETTTENIGEYQVVATGFIFGCLVFLSLSE